MDYAQDHYKSAFAYKIYAQNAKSKSVNLMEAREHLENSNILQFSNHSQWGRFSYWHYPVYISIIIFKAAETTENPINYPFSGKRQCVQTASMCVQHILL